MHLITAWAISALLLFAIVTVLYRVLSKGLSKSARWQQTTRYAIGSIIAGAPVAITYISGLWTGAMWLLLVISAGWGIIFPALKFATDRKVSSDIDNYMDFAVGLYMLAVLSGINIAACTSHGIVRYACITLLTATEIILTIPLLFQIIYYMLYRGAIDDAGMKVITDTNVNEIIEFVHAYPLWKTISVVLTVVLLVIAIISVNLIPSSNTISYTHIIISTIAALTALWLLLKPRKGALRRSGIVSLYNATKDYRQSTLRYRESRERRLSGLRVEQLGCRPEKPSTIMLVIGESASRDYMSAFAPLDCETTPWLSAMSAEGQNTILFKNSYSCAFQTVPALERALTEMNQYNDIEFNNSFSIVDIARKLGYKVTWFSNQGHIGVADTAVSIIAETSHLAQWTSQKVNKVHYDESLLDMLETVDPSVDNFIVLHLKGSHFNFLNRYPADRTVWGGPGVQDNILNYKNSIRYTDSILQQAFEYAEKNLNLQAMIYFSDHATIPDKHRSPRFDGFGQCRIPLFVYLSDEYINSHADRFHALTNNKDRYFTNDLAYELICGVFDVKSDNFDESNSLASSEYKYKREDLLTYVGTKHIADDKT